jgi:protein-disulfide isomerase
MRLFLAPALVFAFLLLAAQPAQAEKIDVNKVMGERVLGKPDAPITINEYASLTCHHCANFHKNVLPEVKKELIETGKAKLVFHDFPLDAYALKASMMARCAPEDKYYPLLSVIFNNQERWTKAKDIEASLTQLGVLAGMDPERIKACMANEDLKKAIVERLQTAQKAENIHETPSFRFFQGGQKMEDWSEFTDLFKKHMVKDSHGH